MTKFSGFRDEVNGQFAQMATHEQLFVTDVSKEELWDVYLGSFPHDSNPVFRERTEHDCQCCKSFIRACGNVVIINPDLSIESIWDIEIGGHYQVVADAMSKFVKSKVVTGVFRHFQQGLGLKRNHQMIETPNGEGILKWDHFYFKLPKRFVHTGIGNPHVASQEAKEMLQRSLGEISMESIDTTLELIAQKSIYRGEEHVSAIKAFKRIKRQVDEVPEYLSEDLYLWRESKNIGAVGAIKNTMIGTLLIDITKGRALDGVVCSFEVKAHGYKRPTSLKVVTKGMIEKAQKDITEIGYLESLPRRHAVMDDITVPNTLFANRDAKVAMNVFDELVAERPLEVKTLGKIEEVSIDTFMNEILPSATDIELFLENRHQSNLMSLVAPVNPDAKCMFKWGNNFSWAYNGEVADSMKALVRAEGGKVDGVLRFTIKWNDGDNNQNDFDAHCYEPSRTPNRNVISFPPNRNVISFPTQKQIHKSSGMLDVDIVSPGSKPAVENIIYTNLNKMPIGEYDFLVHNYSHCGGMTGFTAEIEFDGEIHTFVYDKNLKDDERVNVATVLLDEDRKFKIVKSLKSTSASKNIWDLNSCQFHKVKLIMNSPNHWDGEETGNRHLFFILEGCRTEDRIRGFFNEFLDERLREHRKVFELLGSKMVVAESNDRLSGVGFSSTIRNSVICKVTGAFTRTLKINF